MDTSTTPMHPAAAAAVPADAAGVAAPADAEGVPDHRHLAPAGWPDPERHRLPSGLSASSLNSYLACERRWAFDRWDDTVPVVPHPAAITGTHVHAVLEALFALPPAERTRERALALHEALVDATCAAAAALSLDEDGQPTLPEDTDPHLVRVVVECVLAGLDPADLREAAMAGVTGYFDMGGDPSRVDVVDVEAVLEATWSTPHGDVPVRGVVDRLDRMPDGRVRVVDYKNGRAPDPRFPSEEYARQVRFYAGLHRAATGELPSSGLLLYVAARTPWPVGVDEPSVDAVADEVGRVWTDIAAKHETFGYEPGVTALCGWCPFLSMCPEGEADVRRRAAEGRLREHAPAWELLEDLEGPPPMAPPVAPPMDGLVDAR
ncbi:MAG: RecB family exonuclease [Actinomycetes bacterium]